jgi:hypothetical protein
MADIRRETAPHEFASHDFVGSRFERASYADATCARRGDMK